MRSTFLAASAVLCFVTLTAYGQDIGGKWQTDQGRGRRPIPGEIMIQGVLFDLKVDADNKISGTVTEVGDGDPLTITEGTITGKKFTFLTVRERSGNKTVVTWTGEIKDENTLSVNRVAPRRPVGVAARGGGGFAGGAPVDPDRAPPVPPPPIVLHRSK